MQINNNSIKQRNFVIDEGKVLVAMERKGFHTIEQVAKALDVHRNTIAPYLSGLRALPDCLDRLLRLLELTPADAIVPNMISKRQAGLEVAPLIENLVRTSSQNAYLLFGSRAQGTSRKYSDYDIGVFSSAGLPFAQFSKLIDLAEDFEKDRHYDVNLSNFTLVDRDFLSSVSRSWTFLGGNFAAWIELQKQAGIILYE